MKVNECLPNLDVEVPVRFDALERFYIGPEKWPIFGRFLTLFPLKRPARREKNTSNMAATIGDVMDDLYPLYKMAVFGTLRNIKFH
jgi:hypothetical protein